MKPTPSDLLAAAGRAVPDVIAPKLRVLFCGINPSLYSGFTGHHFARPGNRFWPTLYAAGFTDRLMSPAEERLLLACGYGITNLVDRATSSAAELTPIQLMAGATKLRAKAERYRPGTVAVLGVGAYRIAFGRPKVGIGEQLESLGSAALWVLPNPSGLNAHYTPTKLAAVFRSFRRRIE
jgi:TDG/mug DNA glycosylase family protein